MAERGEGEGNVNKIQINKRYLIIIFGVELDSVKFKNKNFFYF